MPNLESDMDSVWFNICSMLLVFTLAIISPGPNFILVVNRALSEPRNVAVMTAFGVATGSGLFALAGMLGLMLLIHSLPFFAILIRFAGGGYLIYLGMTMIFTYRQVLVPRGETNPQPSRHRLSAFGSGLATNLTNPKAWAFYFSLFTLVIHPTTPLWAKIFLTLTMFSISLLWYASLALLISDPRVQGRFLRIQPYIKLTLGSILTLLGIRLMGT